MLVELRGNNYNLHIVELLMDPGSYLEADFRLKTKGVTALSLPALGKLLEVGVYLTFSF